MESFSKEKTEGKIEGHQQKVRWTEKVTCEVGYTKPLLLLFMGT